MTEIHQYTISIDPGRVKPGISIFDQDDTLVRTYAPCFKAKSAEERLILVGKWLKEIPLDILKSGPQVIIESNSISAGKEIGCFFAGIFHGWGYDVHFVSPIHVAIWAGKEYKVQLTNIGRYLKKSRTQEIIRKHYDIKGEITDDESDSILNYLYLKNRHPEFFPLPPKKYNGNNNGVPGTETILNNASGVKEIQC